jgi:hypothetical protein
MPTPIPLIWIEKTEFLAAPVGLVTLQLSPGEGTELPTAGLAAGAFAKESHW